LYGNIQINAVVVCAQFFQQRNEGVKRGLGV